MNQELAALNSLGNEVAFDDVKDPTDEIYITVEQQSVPSPTAIPPQIKKKVVELVCLQRMFGGNGNDSGGDGSIS